jgi:hypothetical protein
MTAMAGEGLAPTARIGGITLVKGAVARMRQGGWRTLGLWLGVAGVGWVIQAGAQAAGLQANVPALSLASVANMLLTAASAGLGAALTLRLFVQGRAGWLKVDRGLLECAGLTAGMTLIFSVIPAVYAIATQGWIDPGLMFGAATVVGLIYLVGAYAALKLTLWPICRLTGRTDVTVGRAWRLMRKAARGLILGYAIFIVPFLVVVAGSMGTLTRAGGQLAGMSLVVFEVMGAAYAVACYALGATLYRLRVEAPATVADLFA